MRAPFQLRQEAEGSLRKETEDNRVCSVRNKCSRGPTGKLGVGERSSVDLGQARELYNIIKMPKSMGTIK